MNTEFSFGKTGLELDLPEDYEYEVIRTRSATAIPEIQKALLAAIDNPIGCPPLSVLAAGKKTAAISVCDITRPAPNWLTLPPILKRLHEAGIPVEGVTIMIATGLHRAATPEEIQSILGPEIAATYRVGNHNAHAFEEHRYLGTTQRGTPIYIDERFMAADLHITLGFIEQHLMLGFSGGRKLIAPGLAAQETIKVIHSPKFMREPLATEGSITNNPLHAELLEIARTARHDFMLDVTLTQEREISGIFAGDPVEAHRKGVEFLETTQLEKLSGLFDAVITSAAGYPLDLTFYQIVKGITAASHIVKPGGRILLVAECSEGVGSKAFAEKLKAYTGHQIYLDEIRDTAVVMDQWQLEKLALTGLHHPLYFYTPGVTQEALGSLGAKWYAEKDHAVASFLNDLPKGARVALLPEGPYVYARAVAS